MGVVVWRYIDFLLLLIPTPLVSGVFLRQNSYFLFFFLNVFRSLVLSAPVIHNYRNTHCTKLCL